MKYITGIHALNIPCDLDTCGDWHQSALKWENITVRDTENMFFGSWGIENERTVPYLGITMPVANHIRALLDMLQEGDFSNAQGMNKNFISNVLYDQIIFDKVYCMNKLSNWEDIDLFMGKEYMKKWLDYKEVL